VGYERAQGVKAEAKAVLGEMDRIKDLCSRYAAEGISPGGAADMLSLTIFVDSVLH
jgi:triphosphoribosyl-dephospho-CoA synthetase